MTHRTSSNAPSAIERATETVLNTLNEAISAAHLRHALGTNHQTTDTQFRRMLSFYFHGKKLTDWMHDLGVEPTEDDIASDT